MQVSQQAAQPLSMFQHRFAEKWGRTKPDPRLISPNTYRITADFLGVTKPGDQLFHSEDVLQRTDPIIQKYHAAVFQVANQNISKVQVFLLCLKCKSIMQRSPLQVEDSSGCSHCFGSWTLCWTMCRTNGGEQAMGGESWECQRSQRPASHHSPHYRPHFLTLMVPSAPSPTILKL